MKKIKISYSHADSIVRIVLSAEKGNVLDHVMMEEIQTLLNSFTLMPNLKLIVFEGEGKHFSFGASVEEHKKDSAPVMLRSFHRLFYTLRDLSIPTVALISGQCLGGGMELALMCNILFADQTAKFGQPEIILGVFPPPASILLPEKIGLARAEELLITGRVINAEEAQRIGLVSEVYADRSVMESEFSQWVEQHVVTKSASSLRYAVKSVRVKFNHVLSNFLPQLEELYVKKLMETNDANEGIGAFLEKRSPVWENK